MKKAEGEEVAAAAMKAPLHPLEDVESRKAQVKNRKTKGSFEFVSPKKPQSNNTVRA